MGNKEHAFKQIRHCTTWTNSLTKSSALRFHALLAATYIQHCVSDVSGNFNLQKTSQLVIPSGQWTSLSCGRGRQKAQLATAAVREMQGEG